MDTEDKINLDTIADFSWDFGQFFFLETEHGLYEWSDPDHGGDNTIRKSRYSSLAEYCMETGLFVRSKGRHYIRNYCGENVVFAEGLLSEEEKKKIVANLSAMGMKLLGVYLAAAGGSIDAKFVAEIAEGEMQRNWKIVAFLMDRWEMDPLSDEDFDNSSI